MTISASKKASTKKTETTKLNRSGVATRERLLIIAREFFVANGFTGTSMTQIAAKADVNHSLLFHHFGSKLNLWLDVKDMIVEEGKKLSIILPSSQLPLKSFLRELMVRSVSFFKNNPDILRMMNWQRLEATTEQEINFNLSHESKNWIDATLHYQKIGEIDPTLRPEFVTSLVLAVVTSIATDPSVFSNDPVQKEAYIDFCVERLTKSLA